MSFFQQSIDRLEVINNKELSNEDKNTLKIINDELRNEKTMQGDLAILKNHLQSLSDMYKKLSGNIGVVLSDNQNTLTTEGKLIIDNNNFHSATITLSGQEGGNIVRGVQATDKGTRVDGKMQFQMQEERHEILSFAVPANFANNRAEVANVSVPDDIANVPPGTTIVINAGVSFRSSQPDLGDYKTLMTTVSGLAEHHRASLLSFESNAFAQLRERNPRGNEMQQKQEAKLLAMRGMAAALAALEKNPGIQFVPGVFEQGNVVNDKNQEDAQRYIKMTTQTAIPVGLRWKDTPPSSTEKSTSFGSPGLDQISKQWSGLSSVDKKINSDLTEFSKDIITNLLRLENYGGQTLPLIEQALALDKKVDRPCQYIIQYNGLEGKSQAETLKTTLMNSPKLAQYIDQGLSIVVQESLKVAPTMLHTGLHEYGPSVVSTPTEVAHVPQQRTEVAHVPQQSEQKRG